LLWALYAVSAAVIESLKDGISKHVTSKHSSVILAWSFFLVAIPLFAIPYFLWPPESIAPSFWWALLARTLLDGSALILFFKAIRASDLSITIPMISFTPVFLLFTSPLIGEVIPPLGVLGVCLVVLGAYVARSSKAQGVLAPFKAMLTEPGPRLMLAVAVLWTGSSTFHRIGIDAANAFAWNFFGAIAMVIALLPVVVMRRTQAKGLWTSKWWIIGGGVAYAVGDTALMLAISLSTVAYSIALKRMSILGSVVIGGLVFKEQGIKQRLLGAAVMVLGAVVILLA